MDFIYLLKVLRKRKWIIIGSAVLAAIIAWFVTRNEPMNFRSSTRISTGYGVPDEIKVNEENFSLFDAEVKFNNAINIWTSPSVMSLLSYELILHDLKDPNPFRTLTNAQKESGVYKSVNRDQAIRVFQNKLETMSVLTSYKPEEKKLLEFLNLYGYSYNNLVRALNIYWVQRTDYIQVDCLTENPDLSAFLCNNAFQQFIRYYRGIRSTKSQESVDTLQSIMEKKKQELDDKNRLLRGEGATDATTQNTSTFDLISEFEKELSSEKNKQTDNYYELRKVNKKLADLGTTPTTTPSNNNNEELILARKAMNEAYSEYLRTGDNAWLTKYNQLKSEYTQKYGNANTTTTASVPNNRKELLDKKNDVEVDIDAGNEKIKALEQKIGSLKATASAVSSKGANVETLMEEVKLAEREYLDAKQKYNSAYEMSSSAVNNFRQLQLAQPAIEPEPSKRKMVIGMAGAVTFMTATLIIMLLAYLDSSIKTPAIFSRIVNLKMISMVNFMNLKNKNLRDIVTKKDYINESKIEKQRGNVFRESIRKLRYEIEATGKNIFLFTSTQKGQGKTTLIQALSYSLSLSKKKILIIDTNFCNNDLTVQLEAAPVLEKLSSDDVTGTLMERIRLLAKDLGTGNIFVIGSEGGDYTPSEILPRENFLQHLHSLTKEFDFIFLEGPPLNSFTDSKELTQYVDGVVAIFAATHVVKQIDKESINFFKELNGKFCGSVLNKVNLENVNTI